MEVAAVFLDLLIGLVNFGQGRSMRLSDVKGISARVGGE